MNTAMLDKLGVVDEAGIMLTLSDGLQEMTCYFTFDEETDYISGSREISAEIIFTVSQWLCENGYMPSADNKRILGQR